MIYYRKIINHCDINIIVFHNLQDTNFIINIYSDSNQIALHMLCNNIRDLGKTIVMTGDFNIRDSNWDPNYHHHFIHIEDLITIVNSLGLELSPPSNPGPIRFADNPHNTNLVLDLVFLVPDNPRFDKHTLFPELWKPLDHVSLLINVGINKENINTIIQSIKKDSNEEKDFINEIINNVKCLNTLAITNKNTLLEVTNQLSLVYKNT